MVGVEKPVKGIRPISYSSDHAAMLPARWFYEMLVLDNLLVTQSLSQLLESPKMTNRVFADLVLDIQSGLGAEWLRVDLYLCNLDKRTWQGVQNMLSPSQWEEGRIDLQYNRVGKATIYYGTPYQFFQGKHTVTSPRSELKYNRTMNAYFAKKYPYKLKSFAPISGERSVLPVSASGSGRL